MAFPQQSPPIVKSTAPQAAAPKIDVKMLLFAAAGAAVLAIFFALAISGLRRRHAQATMPDERVDFPAPTTEITTTAETTSAPAIDPSVTTTSAAADPATTTATDTADPAPSADPSATPTADPNATDPATPKPTATHAWTAPTTKSTGTKTAPTPSTSSSSKKKPKPKPNFGY